MFVYIERILTVQLKLDDINSKYILSVIKHIYNYNIQTQCKNNTIEKHGQIN